MKTLGKEAECKSTVRDARSKIGTLKVNKEMSRCQDLKRKNALPQSRRLLTKPKCNVSRAQFLELELTTNLPGVFGRNERGMVQSRPLTERDQVRS